MSDRVREPIQTYLSGDERAELDRAAARLGVSRSEALRRGIRALSRADRHGPLAELAADGVVTPPRRGPGDPPPSLPISPLAEILDELDRDRTDR